MVIKDLLNTFMANNLTNIAYALTVLSKTNKDEMLANTRTVEEAAGYELAIRDIQQLLAQVTVAIETD